LGGVRGGRGKKSGGKWMEKWVLKWEGKRGRNSFTSYRSENIGTRGKETGRGDC